MEDNNKHVKQDEADEADRVLANVIGHCLQAIAKVAAELYLENIIVKPFGSIIPTVANEHARLADDRDEDGGHDGTQPSQHEEHVSQEEEDLPGQAERFSPFVILVVHIKEAGPEKGDQYRSNEKKRIAFQNQQSDPIEVGVGLTTGTFEDIGVKRGKTTEDENLRDCLQSNLNRFGLLDNVSQFLNILLPALVLNVGQILLLFLKSFTD